MTDINFEEFVETKKMIRQSKRNIEQHIAKLNPKAFYSYVRNKKVLGSTFGPLPTADGSIVIDDTKMGGSIFSISYTPRS